MVTKEVDSTLWWISKSTPYGYHSPSLNNIKQIQFKNILFEQVSDPCCLEYHMNLFRPGCARHWGSPLLPETVLLLSVWVQQKIMHVVNTVQHSGAEGGQTT